MIDTAAKAEEIVQWVQNGVHRPALVVGWDVPEHAMAKLLAERIPVVDGRVVDNPELAIEALRGMWTSQRFADEEERAQRLALLELRRGLT